MVSGIVGVNFLIFLVKFTMKSIRFGKAQFYKLKARWQARFRKGKKYASEKDKVEKEKTSNL